MNLFGRISLRLKLSASKVDNTQSDSHQQLMMHTGWKTLEREFYQTGYTLSSFHCSWRFAAVKALAITNLLELEKQGKINRDDGFQGLLNAIAGDVRSKHRKRLQRQREMESMREALRHLQERKKYYEEQISSYQDHVQAAMSTMQQRKGYVNLVPQYACSVERDSGRNDLLFPLLNNIGTSANSRRRELLRNSDRTSILPEISTTKRSFFPLNNILPVNTTSFISKSLPTLSASSR